MFSILSRSNFSWRRVVLTLTSSAPLCGTDVDDVRGIDALVFGAQIHIEQGRRVPSVSLPAPINRGAYPHIEVVIVIHRYFVKHPPLLWCRGPSHCLHFHLYQRSQDLTDAGCGPCRFPWRPARQQQWKQRPKVVGGDDDDVGYHLGKNQRTWHAMASGERNGKKEMQASHVCALETSRGHCGDVACHRELWFWCCYHGVFAEPCPCYGYGSGSCKIWVGA
jgi:hypothetical protein